MKIREAYDLREVIRATPRRRDYGRYAVDLCPFHDDHNPSFVIFPDWWECKAGCGSGDIVEWTVRTRGCCREEAIRLLREGLPDYVEPVKRVEVARSVEDLPQSLGFKYHVEMKDQERYWYNRSGLSDRTIDDYLLGYGVPPSGGCARFAIPIMNGEGKLLNIRFRRDDRCPECGTAETIETDKKEHRFSCQYCEYQWVHPDQRGKYMGVKDHNHPILFLEHDLKRERHRAFVCEGELDALAQKQHGYTAVSGTGGAGVFKDAWALAFLHIPKVYDLHDSDAAGREGAKLTQEVIPKARLVLLPEKDIGQFWLNHCKQEFEAILATTDRMASSNMMLRISNGLMRGSH